MTSIEVAEITATARNAEAQIAELASHSTEDNEPAASYSTDDNDDKAGRHLPPPQSNHHDLHHDDGDHSGSGGNMSTPDGNIRPVQPTFFTIPNGLSLICVQSVSQVHFIAKESENRT